jgi:hypothetical protein
MADTEKGAAKADAEKPPTAKAAPPAEVEKAASRRTKLVAETGRYVCREPVVFTTADGKRAIGKVGDVVSMHEPDARVLKKRRVVESEEETAEG